MRHKDCSSIGQVAIAQVDSPKRSLAFVDAVAIIVGIVIGAGIFETPALVAANAGNNVTVMLTWLAGGAISLVGALCYAELATAYPHLGSVASVAGIEVGVARAIPRITTSSNPSTVAAVSKFCVRLPC